MLSLALQSFKTLAFEGQRDHAPRSLGDSSKTTPQPGPNQPWGPWAPTPSPVLQPWGVAPSQGTEEFLIHCEGAGQGLTGQGHR